MSEAEPQYLLKAIYECDEKNPTFHAHPCHYSNSITALALASASVHAQLVWSAYDNNGNLVTANVATGGDSTYGGTVTFTIPASKQYEFVTRTFAPLNTPSCLTAIQRLVSFYFNGSGGIERAVYGLWLVSMDTGTLLQDMGYWGDFNLGGPNFECFQRNWTNATFMAYDGGNALNSGKTATGTPVAGTTYYGQIQVNNKSGAMQLGTSGSTLTAAGLALHPIILRG